MDALDPTRQLRALRTHAIDRHAVHSELETLALSDLSAGEVVIRSRYAGVNYKDCLAITGQAKIMSSFPRIGGIEVVGEVLASSAPDRPPGSAVIVHGFRSGVEFDGGFAELVRAPAAHVMRLPAGLTPYEAAVIGLPGFTAAMALERFERNGITPASGPILMTGAFGAVGLVGMGILRRAGYQVVALTRRIEEAGALRALGASEVIDYAEVLVSGRPLEKERFAAAIDNVGGNALSWSLKSLCEGGCVASVGNAANNDFPGSVLPFIMRGVQLFGIVANADWPTRNRLWARLATDWKPDLVQLAPYVHCITLDTLMAHAGQQLAGSAKGRTLVRFD